MRIDDVEYVRADSVNKPAEPADGMPYVIIRSRDSGCHAGYLKSEDGTTVELVASRRIYYWDGAATLSQLANDGPKNPGNCKFTQPVNLTVYNICEKIEVTKKAQEIIQGVKVWEK